LFKDGRTAGSRSEPKLKGAFQHGRVAAAAEAAAAGKARNRKSRP
jgi:hypothetical protein